MTSDWIEHIALAIASGILSAACVVYEYKFMDDTRIRFRDDLVKMIGALSILVLVGDIITMLGQGFH